MNPAVFVILAVVGLSAAAPQPSGHGSSFKHKTQCHTTYKVWNYIFVGRNGT